MFYIIFAVSFLFALFLIFHDCLAVGKKSRPARSEPAGALWKRKPDPDNPNDSRAQQVVRADGKVIGYIASDALEEYEDLTGWFARFLAM